jgi:acetyl esterase/lipase
VRRPLFATILLLAILFTSCLHAAEPIVIDLWPAKPPGDSGITAEESSRIYQSKIVGPTKLITNVSKPTLTIYSPPKEKQNGTAMLICPGGGYGNLFWELEGEEVAAWLNSLGVTGIILKYRVPRRAGEVRGEPPAGPLLDAQRAMSVVRARAAEWRINPGRIGMIGFSAGGHLAVATATGFEQRKYEAIDALDRASCRPDFVIGCYSGLLKAKDRDEIHPSLRIPANTPPIFLAHASDDTSAIGGSNPDNSAIMYVALQRAGVPAELHIFANGNHDFGVRKDRKLATSWMELCVKWLRNFDFLPE